MKGIIKYSDLPLVSTDYAGTNESTIFDADLTYAMGDKAVKILAWYDNEATASASLTWLKWWLATGSDPVSLIGSSLPSGRDFFLASPGRFFSPGRNDQSRGLEQGCCRLSRRSIRCDR